MYRFAWGTYGWLLLLGAIGGLSTYFSDLHPRSVNLVLGVVCGIGGVACIWWEKRKYGNN